MVVHVWGVRSRRDTAALALDSSLLPRPALMRCCHELTSLLSDRRRKYPHHAFVAGKRQLPFQLDSLVWRCDFGEASGRGLRRAEKSNLHVAKGRAPSTSQDQSKRTGVCTVTTIHVSRGKHTVALRGAGGVDTRHEVEISMEEWGSSVYSLG